MPRTSFYGKDHIVVVELDYSGLAFIRARASKRAHKLLDEAAYKIQTGIRKRVRVDTGATRASVYVSGNHSKSPRFRDYQRSKVESKRLAEKSGRRKGIWWHQKKEAEGPYWRIIAPSTWYSIIIEYVHQAYVVPSVEAVRPWFLNSWSELFRIVEHK